MKKRGIEASNTAKGRAICHGLNKSLYSASTPPVGGSALAKLWWYIQKEGLFVTMLRIVRKMIRKLSALFKLLTEKKQSKSTLVNNKKSIPRRLGLKAGDWVRVKPQRAIGLTLDEHGKCGGLVWMQGMEAYCGKKLRVFKVLKRILIKKIIEVREIKNTVILENVICDGKHSFDCDRSCFYYWREEWLNKVESKK